MIRFLDTAMGLFAPYALLWGSNIVLREANLKQIPATWETYIGLLVVLYALGLYRKWADA
jgi:hypothetical protein